MVQSEFLPEAHWGLDPLFWVPSPWHIRDIQFNMKAHPLYSEILFYRHHPILRMHVQGHVTAVMAKEKYIKYTIDDTTAAIECIQWKQASSHADENQAFPFTDPVPLGSYASVIGRIQLFKDERQLMISEIRIMTGSAHAELFWLMETLRKRQFIDQLSSPSSCGPSKNSRLSNNFRC